MNPLLAGKSKTKKKADSDDDSISDNADDEKGSGFSSADEADER